MNYEYQMSSLEISLHSTKIKYDYLNTALNTLIHTDRLLNGKDTVNVYIDLTTVLKKLYHEELSGLNLMDRYMIISEIINIAAHYRHYFASRLKKYTNIIMYYTDKEAEYCTSINENYNDDYYNKYLRTNEEKPAIKIIMNSIEMVKAFMEYIPNAYVVNTNNVDPRAFVRLSIDNCNNDEYNLIITNNILYYDMLGYRTDVSILENKGAYSKNIYKGNWFEELTRKLKKERVQPDNKLIPVLFSMMNHPKYNITYSGRKGIAAAIDTINEMVLKGTIEPGIEYNAETLKMLTADIPLYDNYRIISSKNLVQQSINDINKTNLENQYINRPGIDIVKDTCNKYFRKNEVILEYLYEGEEII